MNTLITGGSGFIGKHLIETLFKESPSKDKLFTVDPTESSSGLKTVHYSSPMNQDEETYRILRETNPDCIYHLAGISRVTDKIDFLTYFSTNFLTTISLLRGIELLKKPITFFLASSVHVYGNPDYLVTEDSPARPLTPYGYSKFLAEEALRDASLRIRNLKVVIGRLYNCIGPGQEEGFVASDLCKKIILLRQSGDHILKTGPLAPYRRFLDVRDLVKLLPSLTGVENTNSFEIYNIAGMNELPISEMLEILLKKANISPKVTSEENTQSNQFRGLHLSLEKLIKTIPRMSFRPLKETLHDMFEWEEKHYRAQ